MKDKLLKLIDEFIMDDDNYIPTSVGHHVLENDNITEVIDTYYGDSIIEVKYKNKLLTSDFRYGHPYNDCIIDLKEYTTTINGYVIFFRFKNEPPISIAYANNKNDSTFVVKHKGKRCFGAICWPATFDVTIGTREHKYKLKCGSFSYDISEETVKQIYDKIKQRRIETTKKNDLEELNKRFEKYNIK